MADRKTYVVGPYAIRGNGRLHASGEDIELTEAEANSLPPGAVTEAAPSKAEVTPPKPPGKAPPGGGK
jgi:hypothetical protein